MSRKILVLGSSNVDLIFRIPRFHHPGETIIGEKLIQAFGGKGANQAISSKRLGGDVLFVTKVGNDHFGQSYRRYLIENGINSRTILRDKKNPTGLALIEVTPRGENRIVVSLGANASLSEGDLKIVAPFWERIRIFVTQLEIPSHTVFKGLRLAGEHGALTLLNPSPPAVLPPDILRRVDYIVPNELEAQHLTGIRWEKDLDLLRIAERLLEMGPKNVVMTLGSKGLLFKNKEEEFRMKAFDVKTVDTTAAGDAFMGGLAWGLSEGKAIREVLRIANGAAALATTRLGAQPSLPSRKELDHFLKRMASHRVSRG